MPKTTLREFVFGFSINFFWNVWSFLQDDVQCGRRTGMSMLANAQNRWERTGKTNKTPGGATSGWKKTIGFLDLCIGSISRTQDACQWQIKGLGWDSLQKTVLKIWGVFTPKLCWRGGQACWNGIFFPYFGQEFGSFLWLTHGHHVLNVFFLPVFHEWFSPRVQSSSFFKQQVFGCWPDKKTPSLDSYFACHRYTDIFSLFIITKQVSLPYVSLTL